MEAAVAPIRAAAEAVDATAAALAAPANDGDTALADAAALETAERVGAWDVDARIDSMLAGLGFCGLPVQQSCPHANACLSCPMFITTAEFLPEHRQQVVQIITAAEARGQQRLIEMNQQVLGNLDRIITALEDDQEEGQAPDACR